MADTDSSAKDGIRNQFIAVITVNILTFSQGCAVGWVSPALPILNDAEFSPLGAPLSIVQASLVASTFCIGAMVGTPVFGWLADRFGRKKTAMAIAVPFVISWFLKLVWLNPTALICARFIMGFGSSGNFVVCPLYSSEVASIRTRGVLGSMLTFSNNLGIAVIYILGAYLSYFTVLAVMLCVPFLSLFLMSRMPESPSFLVKTKQTKEAAEALAWLRRVPANSELVKKELNQLIHEVEFSNKEGSGDASPWKFLFTSPPSMKALALTVSLLTCQVFTGIFAVLSYANSIFEEAGSTLSPSASTIILGVIQFMGSIVASSLIEKLGRKILFISSSCTVMLSMATLGTYFYVRDAGYDVSDFGWIPVASLSVVVCTFSMGIGPVPFILPSEMFLIQVRGLATSIGLTSLWTFTFLVAQFFAPLVLVLGIHTLFWGFAIFCCLAILIALIFLPETKGRPVEEIVGHFSGQKHKARGVELVGGPFQKAKLAVNGDTERVLM